MSSRPHGGRLSAARVLLALSAFLAAALLMAPAGASARHDRRRQRLPPQPERVLLPKLRRRRGLREPQRRQSWSGSTGPASACRAAANACCTPIARMLHEGLQRRLRRRPLLRLRDARRADLQGLPAALRLLERRAPSGAGATTPRSSSGSKSNGLLQRSIARAFNFQDLASIDGERRSSEPRPRSSTNCCGGALDPKEKEIWTFEIFQYGFKAGHAITPYAVENMGNGDLRSPRLRQQLARRPTAAACRSTPNTEHLELLRGDQRPASRRPSTKATRSRRALRWRRSRPGLGVQPCPFCVGRQGGGSKFNEIRLDGTSNEHARLARRRRPRVARPATSASGSSTRSPAPRCCRAAPGGSCQLAGGGAVYGDSPVPVIEVPKNVEFEIGIDGRHLQGRATARRSAWSARPTTPRVENIDHGVRARTAKVALDAARQRDRLPGQREDGRAGDHRSARNRRAPATR